ncbi:NHLP leader peptide domain-containing protein [Maridesulfovibrio ferrireducens]|uniref:NHLP leader peptide domain-containing protein n=1 Tax=Maridesulfovibrio ferrireducens TaxID=246191 RepID=A0A1G9KTD2_9BACT|nr:NHLP leader peptide family RiPP precursor [Maridesulfovibrio ferrireducens]SDL52824.1 NHLP leader peptide domain-containing protein [Maridesulfovibrio ferrireducens]
MTKQNDPKKQWAKIVAKAWADEDYKQRFLTDPAAVLKEEDIEVPEGVKFKCVEATEKQAWLVLPPKPTTGSMEEGDERLAAVNNGCLCWTLI